MPEENTAESKAPISPDLSFPELEEGELSEEDLEAAAGGVMKAQVTSLENSSIANNTSPNSRPMQIMGGDEGP